MELFDKITSDECSFIENYICTYSGTNNNYTSLATDLKDILTPWSDAKSKYLSNIFGGELIYSMPIEYGMSHKEIYRFLDDKCNIWSTDFTKAYRSKIDTLREAININWWGNAHNLSGEASGIPYQFTSVDDFFILENLLWDNSFICSNIYNKTSFKFMYNNTTISVSTGMKFSKLVGKIAAAMELEKEYEEFRILHSQALNQKKIKGTLHLSIHPIDYMTMSDNDYNWSSCMSWKRCGDYRLGTVEMLNSSNVVVAYVTPSIIEHQDSYWYGKKWRELFIVDPYLIMGIKQYPYDNDEIHGIALTKLRELAMRNAGIGPYYSETVPLAPGEEFFIGHEDNKFRFNFETGYMYNDIEENGNTHLAYINESIQPSHYYISYSGPAECMICGSIDYMDFDECFHLRCERCEPIRRCDNCGYITDELRYDEKYDEYICDECWNNRYIECEHCGQEISHDNVSTIHIFHNGEFTPYYYHICDECLNSEESRKLFGPVCMREQRRIWGSNMRRCFDTKYITREGYDRLHIGAGSADIFYAAYIGPHNADNIEN